MNNSENSYFNTEIWGPIKNSSWRDRILIAVGQVIILGGFFYIFDLRYSPQMSFIEAWFGSAIYIFGAIALLIALTMAKNWDIPKKLSHRVLCVFSFSCLVLVVWQATQHFKFGATWYVSWVNFITLPLWPF